MAIIRIDRRKEGRCTFNSPTFSLPAGPPPACVLPNFLKRAWINRTKEFSKWATENNNSYGPLKVISEYSGTASAIGMAKLILLLWNDDAACSVREGLRSFCGSLDLCPLKILALLHWAWRRSSACRGPAKQCIGYIYPDLWEKGYAGCEAKRQWEKDQEHKRENSP